MLYPVAVVEVQGFADLANTRPMDVPADDTVVAALRGVLGSNFLEALDIGILVRLAGFDIVNRDAIGFAPVDEDLAQELRGILPYVLRQRICRPSR